MILIYQLNDIIYNITTFNYLKIHYVMFYIMNINHQKIILRLKILLNLS